MTRKRRAQASRWQRKQVRERSLRAKEHGLPRPSSEGAPPARRPSSRGLRQARRQDDAEAEQATAQSVAGAGSKRSGRRLPQWAKLLAIAAMLALLIFVLARIRKQFG